MTDNQPTDRGFKGYEPNPPHVTGLGRAIGGLLVNVGGIEVAAAGWLYGLISDDLLLQPLRDLSLSRRVHLIRHLIKQGRVPPTFTEEADKLWARVLGIARIRNQVAHNGVVFGWHGPEAPGAPHFAGVIDRRKKRNRPGPTPGLIPLSEIEAAQNEAADLAQELHALAERIEAGPGWPARQPPMSRGPAV